MKPSLEERFWTKVDKDGPVPVHCPEIGACWVWTRSTNGPGYGQFKGKEKPLLAHIQSWILHFGEIPSGLFVCHHCDNPPCVRPDHLFLGTPRDNTRDMIRKGRSKLSRSLPGENNPLAKLNDCQVAELRERADQGESRASLAQAYGLHHSTVSNIVSGRYRPEAGGPVRGLYQFGRRKGKDEEGSDFICMACGRRGHKKSRGLCTACHESHRKSGTLDQFPSLRKGRS